MAPVSPYIRAYFDRGSGDAISIPVSGMPDGGDGGEARPVPPGGIRSRVLDLFAAFRALGGRDKAA